MITDELSLIITAAQALLFFTLLVNLAGLATLISWGMAPRHFPLLTAVMATGLAWLLGGQQ